MGISLITFPLGIPNAVVHMCMIIPNPLLATVECQSTECSVTRVKKIADSDASLRLRVLDQNTWRNIAKYLPTSTGPQLSPYSSPTEYYLFDPNPSLGAAVERMDFREVPIKGLNQRFATVLNTYYQATISPSIRLGLLLPTERPGLQTAKVVYSTPSLSTYQRHWEWVASALISSITLLGVAITGILLETRVIGPDIYGYVSSLTRDNPYFHLPPNGCTLDGIDRAVLLKDVVVRFDDVAPNSKIGHLAFTMAGYKTPSPQTHECRIKKTKTYSGCSRNMQ